MKQIVCSYFIQLLFAVLLISCQKQNLRPEMKCQSVAYVIDKIDVNGKIIQTDTSICWPQVCGQELDRFLAMSKAPEPICGRPGDYMRLVIWTQRYPSCYH